MLYPSPLIFQVVKLVQQVLLVLQVRLVQLALPDQLELLVQWVQLVQQDQRELPELEPLAQPVLQVRQGQPVQQAQV